MADVPEHFSDTAQERFASQNEKLFSVTCTCYVSFSSESSSTDTDSEPVNKRSQQNYKLLKNY